MERHNLDLGIPITREQWLQLGEGANARPDDGVLQWEPAEFDVIHVSIRATDAPKGWADVAPPERARLDEREVARFVYNEGRPFAAVTSVGHAEPPAVRREQHDDMDVELSRWVRAKWQELLCDSGIKWDRAGAIATTEPNPVDKPSSS
jgi:hypothetical protein